MENSFTYALVLNSIVLIGLIFTQNDTSKDSLNIQKSTNISTPIEKTTWISLFIQIFLLFNNIT